MFSDLDLPGGLDITFKRPSVSRLDKNFVERAIRNQSPEYAHIVQDMRIVLERYAPGSVLLSFAIKILAEMGYTSPTNALQVCWQAP